jgi:hypothetical protein
MASHTKETNVKKFKKLAIKKVTLWNLEEPKVQVIATEVRTGKTCTFCIPTSVARCQA